MTAARRCSSRRLHVCVRILTARSALSTRLGATRRESSRLPDPASLVQWETRAKAPNGCDAGRQPWHHQGGGRRASHQRWRRRRSGRCDACLRRLGCCCGGSRLLRALATVDPKLRAAWRRCRGDPRTDALVLGQGAWLDVGRRAGRRGRGRGGRHRRRGVDAGVGLTRVAMAAPRVAATLERRLAGRWRVHRRGRAIAQRALRRAPLRRRCRGGRRGWCGEAEVAGGDDHRTGGRWGRLGGGQPPRGVSARDDAERGIRSIDRGAGGSGVFGLRLDRIGSGRRGGATGC